MGIKKVFWLGLLAVAMALTGCVKNEFAVDFSLDPKISANYLLRYYASDKNTGFWLENIAPVENGVYEARCITRNPALVYIFTAGATKPSAAFYATRGDKIKITGDRPDPATWEIGGNQINEDLTSFRKENATDIASGDPQKINAAVARFAKTNPDSEASGILVLTLYDRRIDEAGFSQVWNALGEKARSGKITELVGAADKLSPAKEGAPASIEKMQLHVTGDSLVELDPGKSEATLLYFRRSDEGGSHESADSLKALSAMPGSDRYGKIAAISFESDSTAWLMRARTDSAVGIIHAWMPAAETSATAIALSVRRTPFFIVADKKGRQVYRGDDRAKASSAFRRLISEARRSHAKAKTDSIRKADIEPKKRNSKK